MSRRTQLVIGVCFLILVITWVMPELGLWGHSRSASIAGVLLSISIASAAVIVFLIDWGERARQEEVIRGKISELQKKFELHTEEATNLTREDRSSLRIYKIIILSIVGSIGFIGIAVISIMSIETITKWSAAGGFLLIVFAILLAINKRMDVMFELGKKTIVRGIVTNKKTDVGEEKSRAYHWIYIGERRVKVEMALYIAYEIGNEVEFHLFDRFGTVILRHQKIEGAGIEAD